MSKVQCDSPHGATWSRLKTKPEVLHAETNAIAKVAQSNETAKMLHCFAHMNPWIKKLIYQVLKQLYPNTLTKQTKDLVESF